MVAHLRSRRVPTRYAAMVIDATDPSDAPAPLEAVDPSESTPPPGPLPSGLAGLPDPSGLIFDLDGTLVDTVEARIQAWLETFEEVGFPAERRHVAGLIGADGKRLAREVAEVAGRRLSDDRAEAIDRRAGERYDTINLDPRPLAGATDLLEALHRSELPWAIATSSRADQVTASIRALGLAGDPHIIDGSQVTQAKPAPELLLHAAERLGVSARGCWYVGDATWDMRAARAAAMPSIGIPTGGLRAEPGRGRRHRHGHVTRRTGDRPPTTRPPGRGRSRKGPLAASARRP